MPTSKCHKHDKPVWGCDACREAAHSLDGNSMIIKQVNVIRLATKVIESLMEPVPDDTAEAILGHLDRIERAAEAIYNEA